MAAKGFTFTILEMSFFYLLTWNVLSPVSKNFAICFAAASPALMFASAVSAPIFLGVAKTLFPNFSLMADSTESLRAIR